MKEVSKNSMEAAASTYNDLLGGNAKIVFNRADGLMVFKKRGLASPTKTSYWNNRQKEAVKYQQDKYTITGEICRHYTVWQLISQCLAFGVYNASTGDYVITGKKYEEGAKNGESADVRQRESDHD